MRRGSEEEDVEWSRRRRHSPGLPSWQLSEAEEHLRTGVPSQATHLEGQQLSRTFRSTAQRRESRNAFQRCGFHLPEKKHMQVISQGSFCSLETSGPPGEGLEHPERRKWDPQLAGPLQALPCHAPQLLGCTILLVQTLQAHLHHDACPRLSPVCGSQSSGTMGTQAPAAALDFLG